MAPHTVVQSSSASRWNWDVFLSYEGEETENSFASKLSALLERVQIKTFKNLKKEEQISAALIKGIKESRFAIIIFSRNYASSRRCLEELALIIECREKLGQKAFPVFLVGVEGSNVRRQTGSFGEPFHLHQECFDPDMVERWRSALRVAGDLCGWNLEDPRNEEKLIHSIVEEVSSALSEVPVDVHQHPVGVNATVDRRRRHVKQHLKMKWTSIRLRGQNSNHTAN